MEKFHPSDAIIQKTRSIVQDVQAVSQCDDITLRVEQTVGDENILYIKLDILLPEGSTWRDVASKELVEEADTILIQPESWYIYQTAISWDEIFGMTAAEIKEKLAEKQIGTSFGSSSESVSCDSSGYTMLLQFTAQYQQWNDDGITLLIPSFISNRYGQTYSVLEGPFVISWKPENSGIHYEFTMENKKIIAPLAGYISHHFNYRCNTNMMRCLIQAAVQNRTQPAKNSGMILFCISEMEQRKKETL